MRIRAIFLDLDGTLLDGEKHLPPANLEALTRAHARGTLIIPATGRLYRAIPDPLRDPSLTRWAVTINGAKVFDPAEDRTIYRAEIDPDTALRLLGCMEAMGNTLDCYVNDRGYMDARFFRRLDEYIVNPVVREMVRTMRTPVEDYRGFLARECGSIQKLQSFFPDSSVRDTAVSALAPEFPELTFSFSMPWNMEVNHKNANKGAGLLALCRHLDIPPEEVMAIGDECNDLPMLRAAGLGVAMGNASPQVRAEADDVTGVNEDCGVAQAVEKWVLS